MRTRQENQQLNDWLMGSPPVSRGKEVYLNWMTSFTAWTCIYRAMLFCPIDAPMPALLRAGEIAEANALYWIHGGELKHPAFTAMRLAEDRVSLVDRFGHKISLANAVKVWDLLDAAITSGDLRVAELPNSGYGLCHAYHVGVVEIGCVIMPRRIILHTDAHLRQTLGENWRDQYGEKNEQ